MKKLYLPLFAVCFMLNTARASTICDGSYAFNSGNYPGTLDITTVVGEHNGRFVGLLKFDVSNIYEVVEGTCIQRNNRSAEFSFRRPIGNQKYNGRYLRIGTNVNIAGTMTTDTGTANFSATPKTIPFANVQANCLGTFKIDGGPYPGTLSLDIGTTYGTIRGWLKYDVSPTQELIEGTCTMLENGMTRLTFYRPNGKQSYDAFVKASPDTSSTDFIYGQFVGKNNYASFTGKRIGPPPAQDVPTPRNPQRSRDRDTGIDFSITIGPINQNLVSADYETSLDNLIAPAPIPNGVLLRGINLNGYLGPQPQSRGRLSDGSITACYRLNAPISPQPRHEPRRPTDTPDSTSQKICLQPILVSGSQSRSQTVHIPIQGLLGLEISRISLQMTNGIWNTESVSFLIQK